MLTAEQRRCYLYLQDYTQAHHGVSPTFREMAADLGYRSKSQVARMLVSLEERGRIRRLKHHHRAIEVIPEKPTASPPLVHYPNARYYLWDDEAKALKPMQGKR